jgi:transcriptional regulator with XRE-family HTH domain
MTQASADCTVRSGTCDNRGEAVPVVTATTQENHMNNEEEESTPTSVTLDVGRRLRDLRKARHMSLDDVERQSAGRWSASAIGAYERGFRTLSLPRLHELAEFYDVPVSVLLGEQTPTHEGPPKLVLDLEALNRAPDAGPVQRFVRSIIIERGDYNGRVLTIRRDDLRAICALLQTDVADAVSRLEAWGALVESPSNLG